MDIIYEIMSEIGLQVDNYTNNVSDQDTGEILMVNGTCFKLTDSPLTNTFCPSENLETASFLLSYYINKLYLENKVYVSLFYPEYNANKKMSVTVKGTYLNNKRMFTKTTKSYKNGCLSYLQMILDLSDINKSTDLSRYDIL